MRVTVRLFARLREIVGANELTRKIPIDSTVIVVWNDLVREFPDLMAYQNSISTAVNTEYARMDTALMEGDEVAFLPPVSGG